MRRKLFSALFLVTALSIALGAFGHGHQWSKHVLPVVAGLDPGMIRLLALVWFWVSATMLVLASCWSGRGGVSGEASEISWSSPGRSGPCTLPKGFTVRCISVRSSCSSFCRPCCCAGLPGPFEARPPLRLQGRCQLTELRPRPACQPPGAQPASRQMRPSRYG